jgi:PKD repeat protein
VLGVGFLPRGVAITPDGEKAYVANLGNPEVENNPGNKVPIKIPGNTVSVIDIDIDKVATTFFVGSGPTAFGQFIIPSSTEPELPVADFSINTNKGYSPLSVQFIDLSKNTTKWNWNFGDGNYSTEQSPKHIYSVAGNYTVTLTASNSNGTNKKKGEIQVQNAPLMSPSGFNFLIFVMIIFYLCKRRLS